MENQLLFNCAESLPPPDTPMIMHNNKNNIPEDNADSFKSMLESVQDYDQEEVNTSNDNKDDIEKNETDDMVVFSGNADITFQVLNETIDFKPIFQQYEDCEFIPNIGPEAFNNTLMSGEDIDTLMNLNNDPNQWIDLFVEKDINQGQDQAVIPMSDLENDLHRDMPVELPKGNQELDFKSSDTNSTSNLENKQIPEIKNIIKPKEQIFISNNIESVNIPKITHSKNIGFDSTENSTQKDTQQTLTVTDVDIGKPFSIVDQTNIEPARLTEAQRTQMLESIKHNIQICRTNGQNSIKVELYPEVLGKIDIQLTSDKNGLGVTIIADQASTGKLLESQIQDIQVSLKNVGVELAQINVGTNSSQRSYKQNPNDFNSKSNTSAKGKKSNLDPVMNGSTSSIRGSSIYGNQYNYWI